jgi:HTH-type transcriptional regulator/antitoxin HigA
MGTSPTFEVRLLQSGADRAQCVSEIARLQASPNSQLDADRITLLKRIVAWFDEDELRARAPDPIDAIVLRLQQMGLRQADLARWLGGRNRASEILARKRTLSLAMIKVLGRELGIPLDILISASPRDRSAHHK